VAKTEEDIRIGCVLIRFWFHGLPFCFLFILSDEVMGTAFLLSDKMMGFGVLQRIESMGMGFLDTVC
jgi:hypothetical protein